MTFVLKWYKVKLSSSVQIDGGTATLFRKFEALTRCIQMHFFPKCI